LVAGALATSGLLKRRASKLLGCDGRRRTSAEHALPRLVGTAYRFDEGDPVDPNVGESRAFK
jgi:hypothetical protein